MENHNKNLRRSLAVLSHPLTILVFLIYLVNTFLFQKIAPSWWTGKISDFAWLFFFPLVLCVPLSFLISRRSLDRRIRVIHLAVTLCGIPFALLKSSSRFLNLVSETFHAWSGMSLDVTGDPSDLIALLSLVGAVLFWNSSRSPRPAPHKFAYTLPVFAVIFTLADSPMPDSGIYYLELQDGYILACSTYARYQSQDGGMTWDLIQYASEECESKDSSKIIVDPSNRKVQYKYGEVGRIHRSQDGGATWVVDYNWKLRSTSAQIYVQMKHQTNYYFDYPLNAVYEPESGNVIFAMGSEGVLVRQPNGKYVWRPVDAYERIAVEPLAVLRELIWGEVYLGFLLACLLVAFFASKVDSSRSAKVGKILVYLSLLGWSAIAALLPPAILFSSNYSAIIPLGGMALLSFLSLPFFLASLVISGRYRLRFLLQMLALFCLVILTFPLPYALWALGIYNSYYLALLLAISLEITIAVLFFRKIQKEFPGVPAAAGESTSER